MITRKDFEILHFKFIVLYSKLAANMYKNKPKKVVNLCNEIMFALQDYAKKDGKLFMLMYDAYDNEFIERLLNGQQFNERYYLSGTLSYINNYSQHLQFCFIIDLYKNIQIIKYYYSQIK